MIYNFSLSAIEEDLLYRKYRTLGLTPEESHLRLKNFKKHLHNLVLELQKQKRSKSYIENKFKQEFEKICMKMEAE